MSVDRSVESDKQNAGFAAGAFCFVDSFRRAVSIGPGFEFGGLLSVIRYIHIAGHYNEAEDLIVDTHGADVIDPVWMLLEKTYQRFGVIPTLLERDFNIPSLQELAKEVSQIRHIQSKCNQQLLTDENNLQHA